jgi:hypothetical protein
MQNTGKFLPLTTSAVIDAYQNEPPLWDTKLNASEEEKELAWSRLATAFNVRKGTSTEWFE